MLRKLLTIAFVACASLISQGDAMTEKPDQAIFVNALPQSGHYYISNTLTKFFQLQTFRVSDKSFPEDTIYEAPFVRFVNGKNQYLNVGFVPASQHNVDLFHNHLYKVFLHLRDPRDELIAHMDYVDRHKNHSFTLSNMRPTPPEGYFSWESKEKANWQIRNFYENYISWIDGWIERMDNDLALQIHVGTFEKMVQDPLAFFKKVVAFYGVNPDLFTEQDVQRIYRAQYQFDETDVGAWRSRLTVEQQEYISSLIPDHFFDRFDWKR